MRPCLREIVDGLDPQYRRIFWLAVEEMLAEGRRTQVEVLRGDLRGESDRDIARRLGTGLPNIHNARKRGRAYLRTFCGTMLDGPPVSTPSLYPPGGPGE